MNTSKVFNPKTTYEMLNVSPIFYTRLPRPDPSAKFISFRMNLFAISETMDVFYCCFIDKIYAYKLPLITSLFKWEKEKLMEHLFIKGLLKDPMRCFSMYGHGEAVSTEEPVYINAIKTGFVGDQEILVAVNDLGRVQIWYTRTPPCLSPITIDHIESSSSWGIAIGRKRSLLAISANNHNIHLYCLNQTSLVENQFEFGETFKVMRGHQNNIPCLCFNQEETLLASGSIDGTLKIWNIGDVTKQVTIKISEWVWDVLFIPKDQVINISVNTLLSRFLFYLELLSTEKESPSALKYWLEHNLFFIKSKYKAMIHQDLLDSIRKIARTQYINNQNEFLVSYEFHSQDDALDNEESDELMSVIEDYNREIYDAWQDEFDDEDEYQIHTPFDLSGDTGTQREEEEEEEPLQEEMYIQVESLANIDALYNEYEETDDVDEENDIDENDDPSHGREISTSGFYYPPLALHREPFISDPEMHAESFSKINDETAPWKAASNDFLFVAGKDSVYLFDSPFLSFHPVSVYKHILNTLLPASYQLEYQHLNYLNSAKDILRLNMSFWIPEFSAVIVVSQLGYAILFRVMNETQSEKGFMIPEAVIPSSEKWNGMIVGCFLKKRIVENSGRFIFHFYMVFENGLIIVYDIREFEEGEKDGQ